MLKLVMDIVNEVAFPFNKNSHKALTRSIILVGALCLIRQLSHIVTRGTRKRIALAEAKFANCFLFES